MGIPITRPENVEVPPRCCAYSLVDETIMKKLNYRSADYAMSPSTFATHLQEDIGKENDNQGGHLGELKFLLEHRFVGIVHLNVSRCLRRD